MPETLVASLSAHFTWIDWLVVVAYIALTSWLGIAFAGKQATIRDFFLGGRKLPWYAVSGSIIATEISALTFVSVPSIVFKPEGNFTYLQLGVFGALFARLIVAYVLIPAYYKREIYSPYDYMGNQLGGKVRVMTTALFTLGGMLAQSARVYLTAVVLTVVMGDQLKWLVQTIPLGLNELGWSIVIIAIVAIVWTYIGGIATVIWTDAMLFLVFLVGAIVAFVTVALKLDGGVAEIFTVGWAAKDSGPWGKFTFFDFDTNPAAAYTIWTAAIASTWGGVYAYGTDQLLAQRIFCCKGIRAARWAVISSQVSQVVTITVMLVGVGLYAYYLQQPGPDAVPDGAVASETFPNLYGEARRLYEEENDRIFPIFIVEHIPQGLTGLIVAGIFAAAISSLTSILAALSQTSLSAFYLPLRRQFLKRTGGALESDAEDRRMVMVSRGFVLGWGVILAGMAYLAAIVAQYYQSILDLGLAMAGYAGGALLAGFMLSFLPLKIDSRGFMYSGPLSVLLVFALLWHDPWTLTVCIIGVGIALLVWIWNLMSEAMDVGLIREETEFRRRVAILVVRDWPQTLLLLLACYLVIQANLYGFWDGPPAADGSTPMQVIAWPWQSPVGSTFAFVFGYLLARRRETEPEEVVTNPRDFEAASEGKS